MGEICKGPEIEPQAVKIEGSENILMFLIRAEGAARTVRLLQYALERTAGKIERNQPPAGGAIPAAALATAAKLLQAADELEDAYNKIKNEIRI